MLTETERVFPGIQESAKGLRYGEIYIKEKASNRRKFYFLFFYLIIRTVFNLEKSFPSEAQADF